MNGRTSHGRFVMASVTALAAALASGVSSGEPLRIRGEVGGRVVAERSDGQPLWIVRTRRDGVPTVRPAESGHLLVNDSLLVDAQGRIVELRPASTDRKRVTDADHDGIDGEALMWEPLAEFEFINTPFDDPPVFDETGNAVVVVKDSEVDADEEILPIRSLGRTNQWEVLPAIGGGDNILDGALASNGDYQLVAAWRRRESGINSIDVARYVPGSGWMAPEAILSTSIFFQNISAGIDAAGNIVIGYDRDGNTMFSFVYDAASGQWSESQRLSPVEASSVFAATIVQNASGSAVYALFYVTSPLEVSGVYAARFDSATVSWGEPRRLPGTRGGDVPGGDGTGSKIPAAVDGEGNLSTFFTQCRGTGEERPCAVFASRVTADGVLMAPTRLRFERETTTDWLDFADADANETGDVLFIYGRVLGDLRGSEVVVAHYDAQSAAWQPVQRIYLSEATSQNRRRIAFRRGDTAVATLRDQNVDPTRVTSRFFDGMRWSRERLDISEVSHLTHHTASIDGDVVIWLGSPALYLSWLFETDQNAASLLSP